MKYIGRAISLEPASKDAWLGPGHEYTRAQIAALRAQLKAANERLLALERRREEMKAYVAALAEQLKRAEDGQDA
jgi:hypothetical protein